MIEQKREDSPGYGAECADNRGKPRGNQKAKKSPREIKWQGKGYSIIFAA